MTLSIESAHNSGRHQDNSSHNSSEGELNIPPEQRVYVNRNLRLASIDAVGFDLDHTLSHYDQTTVGELAFNATKHKLIKNKQYPSGINDITYDPDFLIRGLIVDLERGNLLKMDCHNYVQRAFHGKRSMSSAQRREIYARRRFAFSKSSYSSIDTLFHIPEVYLYICLVDYFSERRSNVDYHRLFLDIRATIDEAHRDGTIKSEINRNPGRYIMADPTIFDVFDRFKSAGKKLFLLTNSEPEYTETLMNYAMAGSGHRDSWKDFFDIIVTKSNKPFFFSRRKSRSAITVKHASKDTQVRNAYELERSLGCRSGAIIYFGDHTYGDILKAKKTMGWRTGMIVPELEMEISSALKIRKTYNQLVSLSAQREEVERERTSLERYTSPADGSTSPATDVSARMEELDQCLQNLSEEIDNLESVCQSSFNSRWGSLFREGKQISRFGHQVRDFACIYMHKVGNSINYPADHYFQSNVDFMPHELFL